MSCYPPVSIRAVMGKEGPLTAVCCGARLMGLSVCQLHRSALVSPHPPFSLSLSLSLFSLSLSLYSASLSDV